VCSGLLPIWHGICFLNLFLCFFQYLLANVARDPARNYEPEFSIINQNLISPTSIAEAQLFGMGGTGDFTSFKVPAGCTVHFRPRHLRAARARQEDGGGEVLGVANQT
jgi:hypothetical protein